MRKIIIGLSGIVLVAFFVVLIANASTGDPKDPKKATTEMSKDCAKSPTAAACADKAEAKACGDTKTAEAKPCAAPCKATAEAKKDCEAKAIASKK